MVRAAAVILSLLASAAMAQSKHWDDAPIVMPDLPDIATAVDPPADIKPKSWVVLGVDQGQSVWLLRFMDWDSTKTSKAVWVKVDHNFNKTIKARRTMYRFVVSCESEHLGTAAKIDYAASGAVVSSYNSRMGDSEYGEPVIPDTLGETVMRKVCGK